MIDFVGQTGHLPDFHSHSLVLLHVHVLAFRLGRALAAAEVRIARSHVFIIPILPLNQLFAIAQNLLGAEPVIRRQRHEDNVHVRRRLVHVDGRRQDGALVLLAAQKVERALIIGADVLRGFSVEIACADGEQHLDEPDAVRAHAAVGLPDLSLRLRAVMLRRENQIGVQMCPRGVDVGIAGVGFFCALVVGLNPADFRAFVFGEAHDGEMAQGDSSL